MKTFKTSHKSLPAVFSIVAAALSISGVGSCAVAAPPAAQPIHLEAEDAALQGAVVTTKRAGFSGSGYVTGFEKDGARLEWLVPDARAGIYETRVRYSSPGQKKGYALGVNGAKSDNMFAPTGDDFQTASAGKVELKEGKNTVSIERGWGYYDIDALDLVPAKTAAPLKMPPLMLADKQATAEARAAENADRQLRRENAVGSIRGQRKRLHPERHRRNARHSRR